MQIRQDMRQATGQRKEMGKGASIMPPKRKEQHIENHQKKENLVYGNLIQRQVNTLAGNIVQFRDEAENPEKSKKARIDNKEGRFGNVDPTSGRTLKVGAPPTTGRDMRKLQGTIEGEANTAHHILPHSTIKEIYKSIMDSSINVELKVKSIRRFTDGAEKVGNIDHVTEVDIKRFITEAEGKTDFIHVLNLGSQKKGTNAEFKKITSAIEWAKGNQFFGPSASFRYEKSKTGIDTIGRYHINYADHKGRDGYEYVKEHADNLQILKKGTLADKIALANSIKSKMKIKLDHYKDEYEILDKISSPTLVENNRKDLLTQKILSRETKINRLDEIISNSVNQVKAINELRLIEQGKVGKLASSAQNRFVKEHWIKLTTAQSRVLDDNSLLKTIKKDDLRHTPTLTSDDLGQEPKANGYVHYSEILSVAPQLQAKKSGTVGPFPDAEYNDLITRAKTASKIKVNNKHQIKDLPNEQLKELDLSTFTANAGDLKLLLKGRINHLDKKQIQDIPKTDIQVFNADVLNLLIKDRLIDLLDTQLRMINLSSLSKVSMSQLLETSLAYLTSEQIKTIPTTTISSLKSNMLNILIKYWVTDLTDAQLSRINLSLLSEKFIIKLLVEDLIYLTPEQIKMIPITVISTLPSNLLNLLVNYKLDNLTDVQLSRINLSLLSEKFIIKLLVEDLIYLTPEQIKEIPITVISTLSSNLLNVLVHYKLSALSYDQLRMINLNSLSQESIVKLVNTDLTSLSFEQIKTIPTTVISTLSSRILNILIRNKLNVLSDAQLRMINLNSLSQESIIRLLDTELVHLSPEQIKKIPINVLRVLSPKVINRLIKEWVNELSEAQIQAINIKILSHVGINKLVKTKVNHLSRNQIEIGLSLVEDEAVRKLLNNRKSEIMKEYTESLQEESGKRDYHLLREGV